jgi:DNA invertase Pin-like site-specific DNA recombinase
MRREAVVYVRVSSAQQVGNYSLEVQDAACRAYCRSQDWPVLRVFREEGESAKTADRTQLNALLDFCRVNKARIAAVVVHSLSRWSRDTRDHYALTGLLRTWGIALRSATEAIDDTASAR